MNFMFLKVLRLQLMTLFMIVSIGCQSMVPDQVSEMDKQPINTSSDASSFFTRLAQQCPKTIWTNGSKSQFRAAANGQIIVKFKSDAKYKKSIESSLSPLDSGVLLYHERLNYLILQLPNKNGEMVFNEVLELEIVDWVEPNCEAAPVGFVEEEQCVLPGTNPSDPVPGLLDSWPRKVGDTTCSKPCPIRNAISYAGVTQNEVSGPPLVVIMDNGFYPQDNQIKDALGQILINGNPTASWNYCKETEKVSGQPHGTTMAKLVGGSCKPNQSNSCYPGLSQGARLFLAQVFSTAKDFVRFSAIADAISDADEAGARIVNMSFSFGSDVETDCKGKIKCGVGLIGEAMRMAEKVLFVTGSDDSDASPDILEYPVGFDFENVFAIQEASWGEDGLVDTESTSWGGRLDLASPSNPKGGRIAGVSNGIAVASGAAALLLSNPGCGPLKPNDVISILRSGAKSHDWADGILKVTNRSGGYLDLTFLHDTNTLKRKCEAIVNGYR